MEFKQNLTEKQVKINSFLLEGDIGFEKLSLREKMTRVASLGSPEFLEWFYDLVVNEKLPRDWGLFKQAIVEFSTSTGLDSLFKYKEEDWSQYVIRCIEWVQIKEIDLSLLMIKFRTEYAPREI